MVGSSHAVHRRGAAAAAAVGLVAVLSAAAIADVTYFSRGYSATWYQTVDQERFVVDRTTEHRVIFPNAHRPLARYVQGWPMDQRPIPVRLPHIDVTLRARIEIPGQMPLFLGTRAIDDVVVWADGAPLGQRRLDPGPHDLWIHWTARPRPHTRTSGRSSHTAYFRLNWGSTANPREAVPASALTPAEGGGLGRPVLWAFSLIIGVLFAFAVFRTVDARERLVRDRRLAVVLTGALVLLGLGFRGFDYDVMPEFRENVDELFATWNGWSLLEEGATRGWSIWPGTYGDRVQRRTLRFFGERRMIIEPYFEHPPLFHLLVGAAAHAGGADHYLHAKLKHTRLVPIGLMALSTVLLIVVGRRLWPLSPAPYFGALLFSVLPNITLQTRVIKEEDLLVPLLLGVVWFFLRWREDGRRQRDLVLAATCAGLAALTKVPGAAFVPALVMLVAAERGAVRAAGAAALIGLGIASTLLLFGALIDWDTFVYAQASQGRRALHWNLLPRFIRDSRINGNRTGAGWMLFLWLAYIAALYRRGWRVGAVLTVPPLVYLVAIAVGTGTWTYGWYIVPIYPFLCLGAGEFLARLWRQPTLVGGVLLLGLLVYYSLNFVVDPAWARQPTSWGRLRTVVTVTTAIGLAPFAIAQVWHRDRRAVQLARVATVIALGTVVFASANYVVHYDDFYERYDDFDLDAFFSS